MFTARTTVVVACAIVCVLVAAGAAHAQLFIGSRANPELSVGPLFVVGTVTPGSDIVTVDVLWTLNVPPTRSARVPRGSSLPTTMTELWIPSR